MTGLMGEEGGDTTEEGGDTTEEGGDTTEFRTKCHLSIFVFASLTRVPSSG